MKQFLLEWHLFATYPTREEFPRMAATAGFGPGWLPALLQERPHSVDGLEQVQVAEWHGLRQWQFQTAGTQLTWEEGRGGIFWTTHGTRMVRVHSSLMTLSWRKRRRRRRRRNIFFWSYIGLEWLEFIRRRYFYRHDRNICSITPLICNFAVFIHVMNCAQMKWQTAVDGKKQANKQTRKNKKQTNRLHYL